MGGQRRIARALVRTAALTGALLAGLVATAANAQEDHSYYGPRLVEEKVRIPAPNGRTIAATILRPDAQGPYGAIILNHGVSASARERARESSDLLINAAAVFARRGYVVVMPLRRGFGATGGEMAEDPGSCSNPDYKSAEQNAADDVMAAYDYARALPYVDANRMMLAGQSAGGMVSVFTAGTRQPQGLVAVLAFAAGRGGDPEVNPGVPCAIEPVARVFDSLGKNVRVPVLFHYAENDLFFSPKVSRGWYERFNAAGANAEYVLQPAFGKDGHYLFGDTLGVRYWLPSVEGFLAKHGVAFTRLDSADPERQPLLALDRVPNIKSDACKGLYRAFLESPGPRAYAVSADGRCGFAGGLNDAKDVAMRQCGNVAKGGCMLYAVDDAVIWKESIAGQGGAAPASR
ncbi:MAG TPA: prolyl oligopeptidase family serine peptidase [Burkholderiales bacterium]|jgi:dienelactone hydrolase